MNKEKATEMIAITPSTKKRLEKLGKFKDTYDSIIRKLLDKYKED